MKLYLKSVVKANKGTFLATLVKAMLPVDVPDFPVPVGFANPDSVKWIRNYNYNKNHFFDNIDLTDERLTSHTYIICKAKCLFHQRCNSDA